MKKSALLVVALAGLTLVGCNGGDNTVTMKGYTVSHKDYVCEAIVTVDKSTKKVTAVSLEEGYTPYTWAKVSIEAGAEVPEDVVDVQKTTTSGETTTTTHTYYGKYISIDGAVYTGSLREEGDAILSTYSHQTVKYTSTEGVDLYSWLRADQANAEAYYNNITSNKAFVCKADGTASTLTSAGSKVTGTENLGFIKSTTGYWPSAEGKLGWSGNMSAIIAAVIGTDCSQTYTKNADTKLWETNGVATGATLSDFNDYYKAIQNAYAKCIA